MMTTYQFTKLVDTLVERATYYNKCVEKDDRFMAHNEAVRTLQQIALIKNVINNCGFGKIEYDENLCSLDGMKPLEYVVVEGERYEMG